MLKLVADVDVHRRVGNHSVDIFVNDWNVAIEYQGKQHFTQSWRGDIKR
jgi:very-short-patch-repair endonuclease